MPDGDSFSTNNSYQTSAWGYQIQENVLTSYEENDYLPSLLLHSFQCSLSCIRIKSARPPFLPSSVKIKLLESPSSWVSQVRYDAMPWINWVGWYGWSVEIRGGVNHEHWRFLWRQSIKWCSDPKFWLILCNSCLVGLNGKQTWQRKGERWDILLAAQ